MADSLNESISTERKRMREDREIKRMENLDNDLNLKGLFDRLKSKHERNRLNVGKGPLGNYNNVNNGRSQAVRNTNSESKPFLRKQKSSKQIANLRDDILNFSNSRDSIKAQTKQISNAPKITQTSREIIKIENIDNSKTSRTQDHIEVKAIQISRVNPPPPKLTLSNPFSFTILGSQNNNLKSSKEVQDSRDSGVILRSLDLTNSKGNHVVAKFFHRESSERPLPTQIKSKLEENEHIIGLNNIISPPSSDLKINEYVEITNGVMTRTENGNEDERREEAMTSFNPVSNPYMRSIDNKTHLSESVYEIGTGGAEDYKRAPSTLIGQDRKDLMSSKDGGSFDGRKPGILDWPLDMKKKEQILGHSNENQKHYRAVSHNFNRDIIERESQEEYGIDLLKFHTVDDERIDDDPTETNNFQLAEQKGEENNLATPLKSPAKLDDIFNSNVFRTMQQYGSNSRATAKQMQIGQSKMKLDSSATSSVSKRRHRENSRIPPQAPAPIFEPKKRSTASTPSSNLLNQTSITSPQAPPHIAYHNKSVSYHASVNKLKKIFISDKTPSGLLIQSPTQNVNQPVSTPSNNNHNRSHSSSDRSKSRLSHLRSRSNSVTKTTETIYIETCDRLRRHLIALPDPKPQEEIPSFTFSGNEDLEACAIRYFKRVENTMRSLNKRITLNHMYRSFLKVKQYSIMRSYQYKCLSYIINLYDRKLEGDIYRYTFDMIKEISNSTFISKMKKILKVKESLRVKNRGREVLKERISKSRSRGRKEEKVGQSKLRAKLDERKKRETERNGRFETTSLLRYGGLSRSFLNASYQDDCPLERDYNSQPISSCLKKNPKTLTQKEEQEKINQNDSSKAYSVGRLESSVTSGDLVGRNTGNKVGILKPRVHFRNEKK